MNQLTKSSKSVSRLYCIVFVLLTVLSLFLASLCLFAIVALFTWHFTSSHLATTDDLMDLHPMMCKGVDNRFAVRWRAGDVLSAPRETLTQWTRSQPTHIRSLVDVAMFICFPFKVLANYVKNIQKSSVVYSIMQFLASHKLTDFVMFTNFFLTGF